VDSVPLIVPEPIKSPTCIGQPVLVWWASIWGNDQSKYLPFDFAIVDELPEPADFMSV
jgi:hypothetical protein